MPDAPARYSAHDRARWVAEDHKRPDRSEFARDRARVLHCAALRRLAGKTQVLVAGESDIPRTRLTHSLEVAQVAREVGESLGCDPDVVDVAGLAHDLGHPPFGHNGEAVLDEMAAVCGGFEGNAQTFRVLTRLEAKVLGDPGHRLDAASAGLNLTRAALDATSKYPWPRRPSTSSGLEGGAAGAGGSGSATDEGGPSTDGGGPSTGSGLEGGASGAEGGAAGADGRGSGADAGGEGSGGKYGVYAEDFAAFSWMRDGAPDGRVCLEAQVMDWADDVAYSVHDVDDAIVLGLVQLDQLDAPAERAAVIDRCRAWYLPGEDPAALDEALRRLQSLDSWVAPFDGSMSALAAVKHMTSALIGRFCLAAQRATQERHGTGPLHRYDADLVVPVEIRREVAVMKAVAAAFVMLRPGAEQAYADQRDMLRDVVLALIAREGRDLEPWLRPAWTAAGSDAERMRVALDQVASLTDVSVVRWHRRLCR